jgi:hypothetical protein
MDFINFTDGPVRSFIAEDEVISESSHFSAASSSSSSTSDSAASSAPAPARSHAPSDTATPALAPMYSWKLERQEQEEKDLEKMRAGLAGGWELLQQQPRPQHTWRCASQ